MESYCQQKTVEIIYFIVQKIKSVHIGLTSQTRANKEYS